MGERGRRQAAMLVATVVLAGPTVLAAATASVGPAVAAPASSAQPVGLPTVGGSPQQRRAGFEQLLGEHTILAVRAMRSFVSGTPDFQQTLTAALHDNTEALTALVSATYGSRQGAAFRQLWNAHTVDLVGFAAAVRRGDDSGQGTSRASLATYCTNYGKWFAAASGGRVSAAASTAGVRMHVEELMAQIVAYARKDYATAYRIEREAFEHMFAAGATYGMGRGLPHELAVGYDAPPQKLRSAFAMLLGEHMEFMVEAGRAAFGPSQPAAAATAQLDADSAALTRAVGSLFGAARANQFGNLWADHVDAFAAYAAARAGRDAAGAARARATLQAYPARFTAFFAPILPGKGDAAAVTAALLMHDEQLMSQVDAYAAGNYPQAQQVATASYRHMLAVADVLATAIQRAVPRTLPKGGARTGGGGTATVRR